MHGRSAVCVQWVENTLDLRRTPHILWDAGDAFAFDVVDSPQELEAIIRERASVGFTRGCRRSLLAVVGSTAGRDVGVRRVRFFLLAKCASRGNHDDQ